MREQGASNDIKSGCAWLREGQLPHPSRPQLLDGTVQPAPQLNGAGGGAQVACAAALVVCWHEAVQANLQVRLAGGVQDDGRPRVPAAPRPLQCAVACSSGGATRWVAGGAWGCTGNEEHASVAAGPSLQLLSASIPLLALTKADGGGRHPHPPGTHTSGLQRQPGSPAGPEDTQRMDDQPDRGQCVCAVCARPTGHAQQKQQQKQQLLLT